MSSYELMELTGVTVFDIIVPHGEDEPQESQPKTARIVQLDDWVPDDSAVLRTMRGGERPQWQEMLAQVANETAVLRAVQAPKVDSEEYGSHIWLGIRKIDEMSEQQTEVEEARESVFAMADVTPQAPGEPGVEDPEDYGDDETDWED